MSQCENDVSLDDGVPVLQDIFQVEFVVMADASPGAPVDNNRQRNYQVPLSGALTEDQILQKRTAAVAAFERRHMQVRAAVAYMQAAQNFC